MLIACIFISGFYLNGFSIVSYIETSNPNPISTSFFLETQTKHQSKNIRFTIGHILIKHSCIQHKANTL